MTDGEAKWLELYLESGEAQDSVKEAFPDCKTKGSIIARASQLKTKLSDEIDSRLMSGYKKDAPIMIKIIKDLATNGKQEAVRLKAAQDWLSRAGHDAASRIEITQDSKSYEELLQVAKSAFEGLDEQTLKQVLGEGELLNLIQQPQELH